MPPDIPHTTTPPVPGVPSGTHPESEHPAPADHATSVIPGFLHNRLVQLGFGALFMAGGGLIVGHCIGKDRAADEAAMQAEAIRLSNLATQEDLHRPLQNIKVPGQLFRRRNKIEFKPDSDAVIVDASGKPIKIDGMSTKTSDRGCLYGVTTMAFVLPSGRRVVYRVEAGALSYAEQEGVGTPVTADGYLSF